MNVRESRLLRLVTLLSESAGRQADLARRIKKSPSQLNQWLSGVRTISEDSAREIELAVGRPAGWMDQQTSHDPESTFVDGVAQSVSQPEITVLPTTIAWGDLMEGNLPAEFGVVIEDNSMAPDAPAGTLIWFEKRSDARSPDWVLLVDDAGHWYIRDYKERRPGHWEAHAINPDFLPLDSIRDGLRVVAVYMGQRGRKG